MRLAFVLVAVNIAVFILQLAFFPLIDNLFALTPSQAQEGNYWQFVTYMFLHAAKSDAGSLILGHIFINMLVLLIFGPLVEERIGYVWFLFVYLAAGAFSAVFHMMFTGIGDSQLVGASGAVFAIMTIYGLLYPRSWIWMVPVPLPAIAAVFVFAGLQLFFGIFGGEGNVAYFGHLGGIMAGAVFAVYWKFAKRRHDEQILRHRNGKQH